MDNVGAMRERIQLVTYTVTRDKYGGEQKTEATSSFLFAKAEIKEIGTDETFTADQKSPKERVNFTVRFRNVGYTDEVLWKGERYQVVGLVPDAKMMYLLIETRRYKENG